MMTWDQVVPGAHVVDTVTHEEYQVERIDDTTNRVHYYNWIVERSMPLVDFLQSYDLVHPLPSGLYKQLSLDQDLCNHEYIEYNGLRESFKYCKKCDKKE